jgi:xanthine dehydrogenase FAD-binding subunit
MLQPSEMQVVTPGSLSEALLLLSEHRDTARPLAGGTDAMVRLKEGAWRPPLWVHVRRLPELNQIREVAGEIEIGAAVSYGQMLRSGLLRRKAPLLLAAAADIGAVQIQAMGTLGGNLGTASPAGDSLPPLYALAANVRLAATHGERLIPIDQFIIGPGKTLRQPDELITAVTFAPQSPHELWRWQKLGLRGAQAIALVSLAIRLRRDVAARVTFARFTFGAVGPTVLRARKCERMIMNVWPLDAEKLRGIGQMAWKEVLPITDVRASAEYRQQMAAALLQRGLLELLHPEED